VELNLEPTECRSVIEEIAAILKPQALAKGLAFELILPPDALVIRTDRRALSQIILNLANNAIKFTEKGGVYLRLEKRMRGEDKVVEISVRDTGSGIRPEDQTRLFVAFSQVDASHRKQEGTGLGLYLSFKLADLLGGRIACDSKYGTGSTFTFILTEN
jgi:signal transduction histidine kinase